MAIKLRRRANGSTHYIANEPSIDLTQFGKKKINMSKYRGVPLKYKCMLCGIMVVTVHHRCKK